jgi:hypothetical protein
MHWTKASNRHAVLPVLAVRYFYGQLGRHSICTQPDVITQIAPGWCSSQSMQSLWADLPHLRELLYIKVHKT